MAAEDLRANGMMGHLMDALEKHQDIGHYGRLVFAMVGHHFMPEQKQVEGRDYNPPRPEKIRDWQQQQEFAICPTDDPDACNVYRDLKFPQHVYERVGEYYTQKE